MSPIAPASPTAHLQNLLKDADDLLIAHDALIAIGSAKPSMLDSLCRASLVMCISAWQSFVEELAKRTVEALLPVRNNLPWPAIKAYVDGYLERFNTPSKQKVDELFVTSFGIQTVSNGWAWSGATAQQAWAELKRILDHRHEIVHGDPYRSGIHFSYVSALPNFFQHLADCTVSTVRNHLIGLGVADPWAP